MASARTAQRLASYERQYREISAQVADIGFICSGTVLHRYTRCGNPNCACHADPDRRHGPYWQWTTKINGKTVTRRLSATEAALYKEWIANDRQLRKLTTQMRTIANKATALMLKDANQPPARV